LLQELHQDAYETVRPLLEGAEHNLTMAAVVDGTCPGAIWVDDLAQPRLALLSTPGGHYLCGQPPDADRALQLREHIHDVILPKGREWGWDTFWLHYPEGGWQATIPGLFEGKWPVTDYQQYFVFRHPTLDRRRDLPVGFEMAPVSAELLDRNDLANIRFVRRWAEGNFGSRPAFLENGFGFCVTHGSEIAS
jgi:hypothetical protein